MILYNILIKPIEYLIEVIYTSMYRFFGNAGAALFGVSIAVSFLVLPLYLRADAIQEAEQRKQESMERWTRHIRHTYRGDERYMLLTAYYREMGYRPLYALRGTLSLLLQVPFFMAAYHYLSHLEILHGSALGPIADLGAPDALLAVGSISIHILPILMTTINCVSGAIYTKGLPLQQKLQVYILAVIFLILLYQSPAGLVVYWTMNNVFSLLKNLVMKYIRDRKRFLAVVSGVFALAFALYVTISGRAATLLQQRNYEGLLLYCFMFSLLCVLPLRLILMRVIKVHAPRPAHQNPGSVTYLATVPLSITLAVLLGLIIPMSVVSSSPLDFVNLYFYLSPLHFVATTLCTAIGLFVVWGGVIYYMASARGREMYARVIYSLLGVFLYDYLLVHPDVGNYSIYLVFDRSLHYSRMDKLINLFIVLLIIVVSQLIWRYGARRYAKAVYFYPALILLLAMCALAGRQLVQTREELSTVVIDDRYENEDVTIPLSRHGTNVMVIMLDRAIGAYVPFIFDELPELKEKYAGFTFYPNTVSMGKNTNTGSPALFGGYDYTPEAINARSDESLASKHNEALRLMPILFGGAGYRVTVSDVPYAGYSEISDLSIYDDLPYVNAFHLEERQNAGYTWEESWARMERNFFFHSIYKVMPAILQDDVYDMGRYLSLQDTSRQSMWKNFMDAYAALESLPRITEIQDSGDTMFLYDNNITHEPVLLALPDYTLGDTAGNDAYDWMGERTLGGMTMSSGNDGIVGPTHYHGVVAALKLLADWFDYMRENDVYDNTRIILTSDHGRDLGQFDRMLLSNGVDVQAVNPLFMVKDFDSTEFIIDDSFMTNGDTPFLAVDGLIDSPINPYTGNPVTMDGKSDGVNIIWESATGISDGNQFGSTDAPWYHVHDDILEQEDWTKIEPQR